MKFYPGIDSQLMELLGYRVATFDVKSRNVILSFDEMEIRKRNSYNANLKGKLKILGMQTSVISI